MNISTEKNMWKENCIKSTVTFSYSLITTPQQTVKDIVTNIQVSIMNIAEICIKNFLQKNQRKKCNMLLNKFKEKPDKYTLR